MESSIKYVKGVGPKKQMLLKSELNINTFEELLSYYPYKYIDRTKFLSVKEAKSSTETVQCRGYITQIKSEGAGPKERLTAYFTDGEAFIDLVFFTGVKYLKQSLKLKEPYILFGKPKQFGNNVSVVHPELTVDKGGEPNGQLYPQYHTTEKMKKEGLQSKQLFQIICNALDIIDSEETETFPDWLLKYRNLYPKRYALNGVHRPRNFEELNAATYRIKFEELFFNQLKVIYLKIDREQKYKGNKFPIVGDLFNQFYSQHIPFELTGAQKRVIKEVRHNMNTGVQMNRLVQGDVGSGKTMVAFMTALIAIDNGYQACLMAPTEILASQHLASILEMKHDLNIHVRLLTGSTKIAARREIHESLEDGTLDLLIGTHALIEDKVKFQKLGFVIIDEQHRFGVAQRAKLWRKSIIPPHILVMTATPIPRTLAMTLYGDLDVSVIDELPPGRKPIITKHYFDSKRDKINEFIHTEISKGRQVYIVYPLIEESEKMDFKNLEKGYEQIADDFPDRKISIVHGKLKPKEKEEEMMKFKNHHTDIMVATTVIEVGVNVPNASVMIIESAERFGLSQLHQLRGRVGRGADQAYCILVTGDKISKVSKTRMQTMVDHSDGFKISEVDLDLRGPGDIEGIQQSGDLLDLKLSDITKDGDILADVRNIIFKIAEKDHKLAQPVNKKILDMLIKINKGLFNWSDIS
ncbi:ATP-dependent DNA helicase RecG [Halosquirtibacter xylanolyticus]|uniref:ATP-dependent DNA helicase RecG n=1 Tax=Halosquirtibacter xylanolyticus TaxID=3374599 RepID=UPI003749C480